MKKMLSFILIGLFIFSISAVTLQAQTDLSAKTYYIPLRADPPIIDGDPNDAAWNGAYTVNFSAEEVKANGGWCSKLNASGGAVGKVDIVWSDKQDAAGLYFRVDVDDPTQSWAIDVLAPGPQYEQLSDGFQIFLDPMYKRMRTYKNWTNRFNFVPYRCYSGNGMCPTEPGSWWESWQWDSNYAGAGVKVEILQDRERDETEHRIWFVYGYTMEIFLPWGAMNINFTQPKGVVGEKMGMGLGLADRNYDDDLYWSLAPDYNAIACISENNYMTDFGQGKDRRLYPIYYNTIILADANGAVPQDTPQPEPVETPKEGDSEEILSALNDLKAYIESVKTDYTENESMKEKYTKESMQAIVDAVANAELIGETNSLDEITKAKVAIEDAISLLVENDSQQSEEGEKNLEEQQQQQKEDTSTSENKSLLPIIFIIIGCVIVVAVVVTVVIVFHKKKKSKILEQADLDEDLDDESFEQESDSELTEEVSEQEEATNLDETE